MINAEQPIYLIWLLAVVILSWILPSRWIGGLLASSCGFFLALYSPWSLAVLTIATLLSGMTIQHPKVLLLEYSPNNYSLSWWSLVL